MLALPLGVTIAAGLATCLSAFAIARIALRATRHDAAALGAHYGSASAVTFIAASQFVADRGTPTDDWMSALLAVLEIPAILLAVLLVKRGSAQISSTLREVFLARASVLLLGGLLIGFVSGTFARRTGHAAVQRTVPRRAHALSARSRGDGRCRSGQRARVARAAGCLWDRGAAAAWVHRDVCSAAALGFAPANAAVFGTLVASASYIAAPAAVRTSIPEANVSMCIVAASDGYVSLSTCWWESRCSMPLLLLDRFSSSGLRIRALPLSSTFCHSSPDPHLSPC